MRKKLHKVIVFLLLGAMNAAAQTEGFKYAADIKPVDSSGFYNIVLTPELNAHLKIDCSDLRVVNDSGKWVPHLVRQPNNEMSQLPVLWDLKIVKNENINGFTQVVLEGGKNVSDLVLKINNSSAERYCTLTGSDDTTSWFIINDSIKISREDKSDGNTTSFTLRFPPVSYRFFLELVLITRGKMALKFWRQVHTQVMNFRGCISGYHQPKTQYLTCCKKTAANFHSSELSKLRRIILG